MKPRYRYTASGSWQFLTQDGFVPSVSVSGPEALSSLGRGASRALPLNEGRVLVVVPQGAWCARYPNTTANHRDLARGHEACGPLSFKQNNHVSLPHGENTVTLRFAKVRNVHG